MNKKNIFAWVLRLIAAVIMLQTLYFKFTGQEESIYIFTTLGIEPWGRIGSGIAELIASLLILIPRTTVYGAVMGMGIMAGAIFSHLTKLGLVVMNDGGQLFIYALLVFCSCAALVFIFKEQLLQLIKKTKTA
ncbi:MAG: DoxX family protein [Bacteroidota bacterium]